MSHFWIGLATVLWLGTYAVAADEPNQVPKWFPPAVKGATERRTDAAPLPVPARRGSSAEAPAPMRTFAQPGVGPSVAPSPFAPARNREPWCTLVVRLSNAPAMQLSQTLSTLLNAETLAGRPNVTAGPVIVPDVVSNALIIAGPAESVREVEKLVDRLDRAAVMIRLEVVMGDVPTTDLPAKAGAKADREEVRASVVAAEEAQKNMEILFHAQLTTLDNQPASLQVGRRESTITSVNVSPMGQASSVTPQNLGTMLRITPRANSDGVVAMNVDVEDSRLAPANEGAPIFVPNKGEPIRAPIVENLVVQSTIKVANGQTVLLCDMSRPAKNGKQRVILVTVHVFPVGDQTKQAK